MKGNKWVLYQDYAKEGYTHSKTINTDSGKTVVVTYWTDKGREFIYRILKEKLDILPLIETK
ncbi:phage antirepressor KilAC domain-containing protein [Clostridium sp.]|uniref:phage antirepressor KilAC domain-containing protein n=1 Tax=Clostridium sp. TaxID=1506 RepID=UPI0034557C41